MAEITPIDKMLQSPDERDALLTTIPCGYLLTDSKGKIYRANQVLLDWLEYTFEEVKEKIRFQDLLSFGERIFYETRHAVMLKLQPQVNELNYNLLGKTGERHSVLVNSARQLNEAGEVVAIQFVFFLFSDRKKYEQELINAKKQSEEAAAAKSSFMATISHEIRTPIHAILNAVEILNQDTFSEEQHELLQVIDHSSNNLLELVNSVLNITKIEAGNLAFRQKPFSIEHLTSRLLTIYKPLADRKNIAFKLSVEEAVPKFVVGDIGNLRQILTNLIGNAIKFTEEGGIELSVNFLGMEDENCLLQFVVKDTGIGISKEEVAKIFEPFSQANLSIHQNFGGTGLGLSISQKMLQLLQSELRVTSQLGEGSVFSFEVKLPISEPIAIRVTSDKITVQPDQFKHLNLLVVDDVSSNILIIQRYFDRWGIPFEKALSGQAAVEKMQTQHFDLVLMDINMPEMDGYEASRKIRQLAGEHFQKVPIIALSAFDAKDIEYEVKRSGMNDVLPKPFKSAQLHATVLRWTSPRQETDSPSSQDTLAAAVEPMSDVFSLDQIREIFEEDETEINNFLKVVMVELDESVEEFAAAKKAAVQSIYRSAAHKNASKLSLFGLTILQEKMTDGEKMLEEGPVEEFRKQCDEIIILLQQLNQQIREKLGQL